MHTRKPPRNPLRLWCVGCAALVAGQIFLLHRLPVPLLDPGDTVFHVLAFTSIAMMLWIAFDGRRHAAAALLRFKKFGEKLTCAE
jgi:hypothetical protein